jgi:hypothetical protein
MFDVLFIVLTVGFFWLMIAYLRSCESLGEEPGEERK